MSIQFSSLNLKVNTDVKKINIGENEIEVRQYLPAAEKNSLLEITIQEADHGTVVNTFALDSLFHLYMVMKYTDIEFTDEDRVDLFALYDALECNGVITAVITAIPTVEYKELHDALIDMVEKYAVYRNSIKGALEELQMFVPQQASEMQAAINKFDLTNMENVVSLANALGIKYEK